MNLSPLFAAASLNILRGAARLREALGLTDSSHLRTRQHFTLFGYFSLTLAIEKWAPKLEFKVLRPNVANNRIAADREAGCCNSG